MLVVRLVGYTNKKKNVILKRAKLNAVKNCYTISAKYNPEGVGIIKMQEKGRKWWVVKGGEIKS